MWFNRERARVVERRLIFCVGLSLSSLLSADSLTIFEEGMPALASEVNQNFAILDSKISGLESSVYENSIEVDCDIDGAEALEALISSDVSQSVHFKLKGTCYGPIGIIRNRSIKLSSMDANTPSLVPNPLSSGQATLHLSQSNLEMDNVTLFRSDGASSFVLEQNSVALLNGVTISHPVNPEGLQNWALRVFEDSYLRAVDLEITGPRCVWAGVHSNVSFYGQRLNLNCGIQGVHLESFSSAKISADSISVSASDTALFATSQSGFWVEATNSCEFTGNTVSEAASLLNMQGDVQFNNSIFISEAVARFGGSALVRGSMIISNSVVSGNAFNFPEQNDERAMTLFNSRAIVGGQFGAHPIVASNSDVLLTNTTTNLSHLWLDGGSTARLEGAELDRLDAFGSSVMVLYGSKIITRMYLGMGSNAWVWDIPDLNLGAIHVSDSQLKVTSNIAEVGESISPGKLFCDGLSSVWHDEYSAFDSGATTCFTNQQMTQKLGTLLNGLQ